MIDFEIMERALKIAWIKRIIEGGDASWKIILNYAVSQTVRWCRFPDQLRLRRKDAQLRTTP